MIIFLTNLIGIVRLFYFEADEIRYLLECVIKKKTVYLSDMQRVKKELLMKLLHLSIANEAQPKILLFIFTSVF